jgi:hypothetical protein
VSADAQDFITTIIAVYGAVLATIGFALSLFLGINELRRHQPRVRVTVSIGNLINPGVSHSEPLILVEAINTGQGTVVLEMFGFLLRDKSKQVILQPYWIQLPHALQERKRLTAFYACRWFREDKKSDQIIAAYFKDETGTMWKGKITRHTRRAILQAPDTGYLIQWSPSTQSYYVEDRPGPPRAT